MARTKQATKKGIKKGTESKKAETRVAEKKTEGNQPKTQDQIIDQLVAKIKQNLTVPDSKFVQVNENFKKVGPGLSLSGFLRLYKQADKTNFIGIPEYKIAGPTEVVDKILVALGTSLETLRANEGGVIDVDNHESYVVARLPQKDETVASILITSDKIAEIAKFVKTNKVANKKEEGEHTPKKKKAQRRKSPTGVKIEKSPRISVDPLNHLTYDGLVDLLKRLTEKQEGLDVSTITISREGEQVNVLGAKLFKIKAGSKSKRVLLDGALRGLASESAGSLSLLLKELGQSDADIKPHLDKFKPVAKKEEVKEKAKEVKAKEEPKATKKVSKKEPVAAAAEVTKAKTRDVKPRTSKD